MRLTRFADVDLPIYNPDADVSTGEAKSVTVQTLTGGTLDVFGADQTRQRYSTLQASAVLAYDTQEALWAAFDALRILQGVRSRLTATMDDDSERWCYARLLRVTAKHEPMGMLTHLPVEMEFVVHPPWYGTNRAATYTLTAGGVTTLSLINGGNLAVTNAVFALRCAGTGVTAFTIQNSTTSNGVLYAGAIATNTVLTINCGARTARLNGVDVFGNVTIGPLQMDWMRLDPASNTMLCLLDGSGDDSSLTVGYHDAWA